MEDHRQEKYPALWPEVKELFEASPKADIKKTQLPQITNHPDKPCFLLHNVLTKEECEALIRASEAKGFEDAENYCWQYRDRYNDRFMSEDKEFSKCIFDRIAEHLPKKLIGWHLKDLNPRWRYCRYTEGHYFGAHTDGAFHPSMQECSLLTFMLYLNSPQDGDYKGGSTNFITRDKKLKYEVVPTTGMAIVFLQDDMALYHEGAKLLDGKKYILRSDVMFVHKGIKD